MLQAYISSQSNSTTAQGDQQMNNSNIQHQGSSLTLSALISEAVYRIVVGVEQMVKRCNRQID